MYSNSQEVDTGNVVRYNISQSDSRKLAFAGILLSGSGINQADVYNNTVYIDKNVSNSSAVALGVENISGSPTNVRVRNNILYTADGATTLNMVNATGDLAQGNDYFAAGSASPLILYGGTAEGSLTAFRAAGQETVGGNPTGQNVDPLADQPRWWRDDR